MKNLNEILNENNDNANIKSGKDKDIDAWLRKHKPEVKISEVAFDFLDKDFNIDKLTRMLSNKVIGKAEITDEIEDILDDIFNVDSDNIICFRYWKDDDNKKICIAYAIC